MCQYSVACRPIAVYDGSIHLMPKTTRTRLALALIEGHQQEHTTGHTGESPVNDIDGRATMVAPVRHDGKDRATSIPRREE